MAQIQLSNYGGIRGRSELEGGALSGGCKSEIKEDAVSGVNRIQSCLKR